MQLTVDALPRLELDGHRDVFRQEPDIAYRLASIILELKVGFFVL